MACLVLLRSAAECFCICAIQLSHLATCCRCRLPGAGAEHPWPPPPPSEGDDASARRAKKKRKAARRKKGREKDSVKQAHGKNGDDGKPARRRQAGRNDDGDAGLAAARVCGGGGGDPGDCCCKGGSSAVGPRGPEVDYGGRGREPRAGGTDDERDDEGHDRRPQPRLAPPESFSSRSTGRSAAPTYSSVTMTLPAPRRRIAKRTGISSP